LTPQERSALREYTSPDPSKFGGKTSQNISNHQIDPTWPADAVLRTAVREQIATLNSAMAKAPLKTRTVHRGMNNMSPERVQAFTKKGNVLDVKTMWSVTDDVGQAEIYGMEQAWNKGDNWVQLKIRSGRAAPRLDEFAVLGDSEAERLLMPGTYRVAKVTKAVNDWDIAGFVVELEDTAIVKKVRSATKKKRVLVKSSHTPTGREKQAAITRERRRKQKHLDLLAEKKRIREEKRRRERRRGK